MNFRELEFADLDWMPLSQDGVHWRAYVNAEMILYIP